jgi:hypothetical protein
MLAVIGCGSSTGWRRPNGTFCVGLVLVIGWSRGFSLSQLVEGGGLDALGVGGGRPGTPALRRIADAEEGVPVFQPHQAWLRTGYRSESVRAPWPGRGPEHQVGPADSAWAVLGH